LKLAANFVKKSDVLACSSFILRQRTAQNSEKYAAPIFIIEMMRLMWQQKKQANR